jgi:hypothetical protein
MADAGYSGTPQARKLGLKPGMRVALDHAPGGWALDDPPDGITLVGPRSSAEVIVCFCRSEAELAKWLVGLGRRIFPDGAVWLAWPRRAGGHESDVTDNVVREHALPLGLVDVKVAAIDPDWSGLRLVWRKELRSDPRPDRT